MHDDHDHHLHFPNASCSCLSFVSLLEKWLEKSSLSLVHSVHGGAPADGKQMIRGFEIKQSCFHKNADREIAAVFENTWKAPFWNGHFNWRISDSWYSLKQLQDSFEKFLTKGTFWNEHFDWRISDSWYSLKQLQDSFEKFFTFSEVVLITFLLFDRKSTTQVFSLVEQLATVGRNYWLFIFPPSHPFSLCISYASGGWFYCLRIISLLHLHGIGHPLSNWDEESAAFRQTQHFTCSNFTNEIFEITLKHMMKRCYFVGI